MRWDKKERFLPFHHFQYLDGWELSLSCSGRVSFNNLCVRETDFFKMIFSMSIPER
jgi:hypothetical protein